MVRISRAACLRALTLLTLGLASERTAAQERPRLLVYVPTSTRARTIQSSLERQMPQVEVVVCGRHRDFTREIERGYDAALAAQPVLEAQGLSLDVKGYRDAADNEPYVLLSVGASPEKSQLPKLTLGAVDLLGRERTGNFIAGLLGLASAPELKYVTKSEDLLPLLQFGSASAVVLSAQDAQHLKGLSKLDLRSLVLSKRVGLPALSLRSEMGRRVVRAAVESLDLEIKRKLGVDSWH